MRLPAAATALLVLAGTALLGLGAAAPPAAAQAELGIRIELTGMTPRLVTADGPAVLTVTGRVSNDGDRTIEGLDVRVQRGEAVRSESELRAALAGDATTEAARPRFTDLPGSLGPGGSMPFTVQVPLRGGGPLDSLQITEPGVYPLLVNLNGSPDFGNRARLAAVRLLLPAIGLPAQDATLTAETGTPPAQRVPLTLLWPLVDTPRRLPTPDEESVVLADDSLAESMGEGGRLSDLVRSAAEYAPPGSPLSRALCFAIDPDLVDTARLMAERGYRLPDDSPGNGQQVAARWLGEVRELVAGRCVLALPMSDVDLVALSRAGLTDLLGRARTDGAQILRDVLQVSPITELAWPDGELVDERTLTDLSGLGVGGVLLQSRGLTDGARFAGQPAVGLTTGSPATASARAVLVDTLTEEALTERPPAGEHSGGQVGLVPSTSPSGTDAPLAGQDGLATLTFRAMGGAPGGVLLALPRRWSVSPAESDELLRVAGRLVGDGWAQARDLGSFVTATAPESTTTLNYPVEAGATEISRAVTAEIDRLSDELRDVEASTTRDPRGTFDPARLLDPMKFGLLRGASTAWRDDPGGAQRMLARTDDRLTQLVESVQIVPPGGPYLLAASNSPLLLNLSNPLAVQIDVRITLEPTAGIRTAPVDVVRMPARSNRQVRIPAEVVRAGQFSVAAQLSTPGGTALGPRGAATRIQLRSTAYGTVTLVVTLGGFGALVLLSAIRITRRVRASRATNHGE
ncbi:MAG TPA: DUF6049 family protein [Pseudonocardiaceae bacterium]